MQKKESARGCNKTKMLRDLTFVDVNEELQPISNFVRQLYSLLGCLTRDPEDCHLIMLTSGK